MNFQPVKFESAKKQCPLPFAVTVTKTAVVFRLTPVLVDECKLKPKTLMSLYYDDGASLFALVEDPENKHGEAKRLLCTSSAKKKSLTLTITFPRVDLMKRIWKNAAPITGLPLYPKRGPGKIVFHAPTGK